MRWSYACSLAGIVRIVRQRRSEHARSDVFEALDSDQAHGHVYFLRQELQGTRQPGLAVSAQASDKQLANQYRSGPQSQALQDIGASLEPAVHQHLRTARHGLGYFAQHLDARRRVVQLPSAVV